MKTDHNDTNFQDQLKKIRREELRELRAAKIDEIGWKFFSLVLIISFILLIVFCIQTCNSSNGDTGYRHYPSVDDYTEMHEYYRQRNEEGRRTIESYTPPADGAERFRRTLREGNKENRLIEKFDRGDYKDYYEYHDGPEGNIGDVDYHEIEDYFGGERD